MKEYSAESLRYDGTSVALHWITAVVVVLLWCLGQTIDWFPKDFPRVAARGTHIVLGAMLALLMCYRIWWRLGRGMQLPAAGSGWIGVLGKTSHMALYVLLVTTVALGLSNAWVRGDNLFDLFRIPSFAPGDKALRAQVEDLHALAANVLLVLAGLHAAAGLAHHFLLRDQVMRRMWPRRWTNRSDASVIPPK